MRDIRDRHAAQARIHHMAHHDALTGLPNRVSFMDHLEHSMLGARSRRVAARAALHRPRSLQARQRFARPHRRRRAAADRRGPHRRVRCAAPTSSRASAATSSWCWCRAAIRSDAPRGRPSRCAEAAGRDRGADRCRRAAALGHTLDRHRVLSGRRRSPTELIEQRRLGDVPGQGARAREPPVLRPRRWRRRRMPRW